MRLHYLNLPAMCLSLVLIAANAALAKEPAIFVSPMGNDAWSGEILDPNQQRNDGPVATPQRARDLIRAIKRQRPATAGAIHIYLRGGDYFLSEPLVLTPDDSGSEQTPVIWSAYENEHPILSGGTRLAGWIRATMNGIEAWTVKLPADAQPMIRELWLDGRRLSRCRLPKHGTFAVGGLSDGGKHNDWQIGVAEFRYADKDLKAWPTAADGEAIVATRWIESHLPITSIDEKHQVIHFGKRSVFQVDPGDRYWLENVREGLTGPDEFYVDPRDRSILLIPPAGVDPNKAQIVAPRLAQVLLLAGDPAAGKFVEYVAFHGLAFAHTEWFFDYKTDRQQGTAGAAHSVWDLSPDPSRSGFHQAAIGVPAAVSGSGVRHCEFERCQISHVGTYGLELARGCQKNRITHCALTDLGAGGVKIGEVVIRNGPNDETAENEISDCTIADGGNLFPSCVALWIGQAHDNLVSHNDIHGFCYTGISIGWTWGYGASSAQRNTVEYNHVHHIGVKADGIEPILSDMAGIYTLGNQEGSLIRFNRFHDIAALKYGGWGIYFDEGTTHLVAENNLVYRTTHGGFHQHYGRENIVRNNIFAFGRDAQIQRSRVEDHESFLFERNIVLWNHGSLLAGDWHQLNVRFDHNTYWHQPPGEIRFAERTWDQWRRSGMDAHSKIGDPHFINPAGDDFRLKDESSESLAGFRPFDLSAVGPR